MLKEICRISFDEQTLKDDLNNYTYANNLDQSIAQYVENGEGFALSTLNLFTKQGPYFQIDTTSEFYHQFENNDYFEISFDVFFTNIVGYAKHICYFQAYDDISQKYVSFGARLSCDVYPTTYDRYLSDITTITTNKWYTFRIVVDNKNNVVNVYQDDVLIISWNNTYHFIPTSVCVGNIFALDRVYNYAYVDNISIKTQVEDEEPTSKYPKFDKLNLPKPLQQGYSQTLKPIVLRSEMTDGSIRQRLLNPSAPGTISCTLQLTVEQLAIFRKFYEEELDYGANWFVLPLLSTETNDIVSKLVRIQNGELQLKLLHRNQITSMYQIQLKLDVDETVEV